VPVPHTARTGDGTWTLRKPARVYVVLVLRWHQSMAWSVDGTSCRGGIGRGSHCLTSIKTSISYYDYLLSGINNNPDPSAHPLGVSRPRAQGFIHTKLNQLAASAPKRWSKVHENENTGMLLDQGCMGARVRTWRNKDKKAGDCVGRVKYGRTMVSTHTVCEPDSYSVPVYSQSENWKLMGLASGPSPSRTPATTAYSRPVLRALP
jgi:hypothetical protein